MLVTCSYWFKPCLIHIYSKLQDATDFVLWWVWSVVLNKVSMSQLTREGPYSNTHYVKAGEESVQSMHRVYCVDSAVNFNCMGLHTWVSMCLRCTVYCWNNPKSSGIIYFVLEDINQDNYMSINSWKVVQNKSRVPYWIAKMFEDCRCLSADLINTQAF